MIKRRLSSTSSRTMHLTKLLTHRIADICDDHLTRTKGYRALEPCSEVVSLTDLPTDILVRICNHLPVHAKGCLALTSKAFSFLLHDARSGLQFRPECSMAGIRFNYPSECHNQRYIFLRLLEVDLHPHQFLCWDCFTLHSRAAFSASTRWAEVKLCRRRSHLFSRDVMFMSCCRDGRMKEPWFPEKLAGVVDLCPCIKLTPTRKRRVEAEIRKTIQSDGTPLAPWHSCYHQYNRVRLEIKIWFYFKDSTSPLTARVEYRRTGPKYLHLSTPRRYCPHQGLDETLSELSRCHNDHEENSTCATYQRFKKCPLCQTELIKACVDNGHTSVMRTHLACFERCLSDESWMQHTVYLPEMLPRSKRPASHITS